MNKIQHYRERAGYTQSDLADIMQVSTKTITRWESGVSNPDYTQGYKLARILKVPMVDILPEPEESSHFEAIRREIATWQRYVMLEMPTIIEKEVLAVDPEFDFVGKDITSLKGLAMLPQTGAVKAQIEYLNYITSLSAQLPPDPSSVKSIREREIREALEWMERTWVKPQ